MTHSLFLQCMRVLATSGALLVSAVAGQADPTTECSIKNSSQVEIGNCIAGVEKDADAAMAIALEFAMNSAAELDSTTGRVVAVPALKAGQEAWLQYRDKHCEFVGATFGGGSGTGIAIRNCRIELARERFTQLMQFAR
jgi:uncharacterized protein YecT (DUF1311 family)